MNSAKDYDKRIVELREGTRLYAQPTVQKLARYQVAQMMVKEFYTAIQKKKIVKVYHVTVSELSQMR